MGTLMLDACTCGHAHENHADPQLGFGGLIGGACNTDECPCSQYEWAGLPDDLIPDV